jgi:MinD superfamily P-loop ATPase
VTIAIASGKGGTGKTTIALGLACVSPAPVYLVDCDVEEPNCHLFLEPAMRESHEVRVYLPRFDNTKCTGCGACVSLCKFGALALVNGGILLFPELCHNCGGCQLVCPADAVSADEHSIGVVESGQAGRLRFTHGRLRIGHPSAVPVIRAAQRAAEDAPLVLIDAPPGTSCAMVAAIRTADFVVLVTEPTPFGLHDLKLAVETVRVLALRHGVVVNRMGIGDNRVHAYCAAESVPLLAEVADDRSIAELYSRGELIANHSTEFREQMRQIWRGIEST